MNAVQNSSPSSHCQIRQQPCSIGNVHRVAAMLDLGADEFTAGSPLPRGWHFFMLGADTRRSRLRADGFPGLGVPMPDLGFPRLMMGGRTMTFNKDIPIGAEVESRSSIQSLVQKKTATGEMAVATLAHDIHVVYDPMPAIQETQTYLLLPAALKQGSTPASGPVAAPAAVDRLKSVVPDEIMLFQYSALGFNSHRIHTDRDHATKVEGFPDLVVNGGLSTLLLTEVLRKELGVTPRFVGVRHLAPLFCNQPIAIHANLTSRGWDLKALDHQHRVAVTMEVESS